MIKATIYIIKKKGKQFSITNDKHLKDSKQKSYLLKSKCFLFNMHFFLVSILFAYYCTFLFVIYKGTF